MARVDERRVDARRDLDLLAVVDRRESAERRLRRRARRRAARRGRCRGFGGWARSAAPGRPPGARPVRRVESSGRARRWRTRWRRRRRRRRTVARGLSRTRRRPRPARSRPGRLGLVLAVLDDRLVGMALLPASIALGELLLELARVEQHERGQLDRARGRPDRPAKPAFTRCGMSPQWSRWAWVSRIASSVFGS